MKATAKLDPERVILPVQYKSRWSAAVLDVHVQNFF